MDKVKMLSKITILENEIKELKELIKCQITTSKSSYQSAKEWLEYYISKGFKIKETEGYVTYYIDGQWIFQKDFKNQLIRCYYYEVWEVFSNVFNLKYEQINSLHKEVLGEVFKCNDFSIDYDCDSTIF